LVNISETKRDTTGVPLAKMFISTWYTKNIRKCKGGGRLRRNFPESTLSISLPL